MAWSASKICTAWLIDTLAQTTAMDIDTDASIKSALFDNTITPNQLDTAAHNAYAGAGGTWATGGVSDASGPRAARAGVGVVGSSVQLVRRDRVVEEGGLDRRVSVDVHGRCLGHRIDDPCG